MAKRKRGGTLWAWPPNPRKLAPVAIAFLFVAGAVWLCARAGWFTPAAGAAAAVLAAVLGASVPLLFAKRGWVFWVALAVTWCGGLALMPDPGAYGLTWTLAYHFAFLLGLSWVQSHLPKNRWRPQRQAKAVKSSPGPGEGVS
jgi:hypothetical protein